MLSQLHTELDRNKNLQVLERMKSILDLNKYRHQNKIDGIINVDMIR